MEELSSI
jgi:hypothetical protein